MNWILILSINGEPTFEESFPQFELQAAITQAKTIYGSNLNVIGQKYIGDQ